MKFELLSKATHADENGTHILLEAGTQIGDGTPYPIRKGIDQKRTALLRQRDKGAKEVPWFIPGHHMKPLDKEAEVALAAAPEELTLEQMPLMAGHAEPGAPQKAVGF